MPPEPVNLRQGETIWDVLSRHGVPSSVVRCPCTFPPSPILGRVLSGMGVPDLRGGFGTGTFYTTAPQVAPRESEQVVHLDRSPLEGPVRTVVIGPRQPRDRADLTFPLELSWDAGANELIVRSEGQPNEVRVAPGQWSDWLRTRFKAGLFAQVRGLVRFHLIKAGPTFELYASPVNFDPREPLYPISSPTGFAAELADRVGDYHTTGMVEDHAGRNNERLGEAAFLAQCDQVWDEREAMLFSELERDDARFVYCLFDTPDRVQHMLWRHRDPDHPANRDRPRDPELARAIDEQYRRADAILGAVLAQAGETTLVIALSDHGFGPFRRGVDLNRWLHAQGLLALRDGCAPGLDAPSLLRGIDWSRTTAYAVGLSGLYLNVQGRESEGIVAATETVRSEIADRLTDLVDPANGARPIRCVRRREDVYQGPHVADAPDLLVFFESGYRVSWESSLGGVGADVIADNLREWSGDHIIDPALAPGVLAANRPLSSRAPALADLAPTVLAALGVPATPILEGSSLLP